MSILWKILLVCIILGGAQWLHSHPDSPQTQQLVAYLSIIRIEWNEFLTHFTDYVSHFPTYIRQLLDTAPTPKKP